MVNSLLFRERFFYVFESRTGLYGDIGSINKIYFSGMAIAKTLQLPFVFT